jgi:hypothetical protein
MIEKAMMVNGLDFKRKKMITMTKRKRTLVKREKKKNTKQNPKIIQW